MNEQSRPPTPPLVNPYPQQVGAQSHPGEQYEMMQMRLAMRDSEHLDLMAILHYVWAGLVGLGAVFFIGYMFMMGAIFEEAMKAVPPTVTTSSPAGSSSSVTPVSPATPATPAGASTTSSPSSTTVTHSTASSAAMMDTMFRWMYIMYGVLAGLCVIGCICNILSARWMQKRKHRVFSMVVGAINVVMIPLGTILGIFTFIVLCRQSVAQMYTPMDILTQRDPR